MECNRSVVYFTMFFRSIQRAVHLREMEPVTPKGSGDKEGKTLTKRRFFNKILPVNDFEGKKAENSCLREPAAGESRWRNLGILVPESPP